jgi:hypothetical protein
MVVCMIGWFYFWMIFITILCQFANLFILNVVRGVVITRTMRHVATPDEIGDPW